MKGSLDRFLSECEAESRLLPEEQLERWRRLTYTNDHWPFFSKEDMEKNRDSKIRCLEIEILNRDGADPKLIEILEQNNSDAVRFGKPRIELPN